jgi:hypothetical protein
VTGRDRRDFPGFYAAGLGGFGGRPAATAQQDAAYSMTATTYVCTGPLTYTGLAAARSDIENLRAATQDRDVEPFLPRSSPTANHHRRHRGAVCVLTPHRARSAGPVAECQFRYGIL